jgi:hypothetical protein
VDPSAGAARLQPRGRMPAQGAKTWIAQPHWRRSSSPPSD